MKEVFISLIKELNSSVFVLIAILICTFWVLFKIGRWSHIFQSHEEKISRVENLADKVLEIRVKVDLIYQYSLGPKGLTAPQSPIGLTEKGKEVVEKIKANAILERCLPQLIKEVAVENPNNAYDIQTVAMRVAKEKMLGCLNEAELTTVKEEAYIRGILVEDIMSVFGVLLRNHILEQKGISISDVNKYAPPTD